MSNTTTVVRDLADAVRDKILANEQLITRSEGEVTVRIFRRREGNFEIKLTTTV